MTVQFSGDLETDLKRLLAELRAGVEQLEDANERLEEMNIEKDGYSFSIEASVGGGRFRTSSKSIEVSMTEADLMRIRKVSERDKFRGSKEESAKEMLEEDFEAEEVAESPEVDPAESVKDTVLNNS